MIKKSARAPTPIPPLAPDDKPVVGRGCVGDAGASADDVGLLTDGLVLVLS